MASNKAQLMAQFYEQCQKKGYTDMRDATQSLKAKVIATDLGLRYGNIVEFYEKAAQCYQQVQDENTREAERLCIQKQEEQAENARRAVNGTLLVTISDSKTTLKVYLRPDGTTYCTVNDGGKIEGIPSLSVHKGGSLQYTYHPSETVFTGASSGGIMMGGTHQTEAYYSERVSKSGKGYIKATIGGTEVSVTLVTMSEYTQACFKRDEQFKRLVSNGRIRCTKDSEMANILARSALSGGGDIYMQMSQLTMAADEKRLPYETCKEITDLLGRIIYGYFPPTDAEIYDCAKNLAGSKTSAQLLSAIEMFQDISDYKDASRQIKAVQVKYEEVLQTEKEQAILEKEAAQKKNARILKIVVPAVCAIITVTLLTTKVIIPNSTYNKAVSLMEAEQYEEAIAAFEAMDGYKDSAEQIVICENAIVSAEQTRIEEEKAIRYTEAETLAKNNELGKAAIAFAKMGDYLDARERSLELWEKLSNRKTIATGYKHSIGLKKDGTMVATGGKSDGQCNVSSWGHIVAIDAENGHTVGLKADGTVLSVGYNDDGQCNVSDWTNIVDIAAGSFQTIGLKIDGTAIAVGWNEYGQCDVSNWTDIVALSAGGYHTVGVKADGTVVSVGNNDKGQCNTSGWTNIVAISAGKGHTVGLKADGTVVATGWNDNGQCNVSGWTNIVAISADNGQTVGLKADGTVLAVGYNEYAQCDTENWTDIVAVSAGSFHTIGLKADGTMVAAGWNDDGQCNVSGWKSIKFPN